jgi:hypothetical protein
VILAIVPKQNALVAFALQSPAHPLSRPARKEDASLNVIRQNVLALTALSIIAPSVTNTLIVVQLIPAKLPIAQEMDVKTANAYLPRPV